MLTIQQLIKVLRQLQNSASTNSSNDLVKVLKQAAVATTTDFIPPAGMVTSAPLSAPSSSSSSSSSSSTLASKSPQQPQQTSGDCSQQQQQQQQSQTQVDSQTNHNTTASLILHLNESSLTQKQTTTNAVVSTTQDSYKATAQISQYLQRSQQIQNFYQQQLHHFHTQHNRSDFAKQKQTQFSMSSLAAEPLALKQDEIIPTNLNGSADNANTDAASSTSTTCGSTGKPCFNTGLAEILQFMELIGNLKHTKRTGWVLRDVNDCESISGHMYRMSMMTFLLDGSEGLNQIRCMELALVHDLAESLVGDITPFCGVSKQDKRTMEFKAMDDICKLIEPRGKRIMELFQEYEHGESAESKFVKDLDRLDMVMQAYEYEKRDNCLLKHQEFFDSTEGKFNHPFVKKLVAEIYEQRKVLAKNKGALAPPSIHVPNMDLPPQITSNGHCVTSVLEQPNETQTPPPSS